MMLMWLYAGELSLYGHIIVVQNYLYASGGPAGCVVAGRLAYADPNLHVMLIEGEEIYSQHHLLLYMTLVYSWC